MTDAQRLENEAAVFLDTHKDWAALTNDEMDFLRKRNFRKAEEIFKRKAPLVERYQKQLKALHDKRLSLPVLPEATRKKLREAQKQFDKINEEYVKQLKLALNASERMVAMIKNAMTQHLASCYFYGKSGALKPQAAPRSVTINKKA